MLVAYFDEVKYAPGNQPYYWLGALVAPAASIWSLEQKVNALSSSVFGTPNLSRDTEFHAAEIFHRKRNFKSWSETPKRLEVLKSLLRILDEDKEVARIYVRIDPSRMIATDLERKAFMFLTERVELHLRTKSSPGILIGDRENDDVAGIFAETLSRYRSSGTPYAFGTKLTHLIDTVHFTSSHHSRMLQLADLYVWSLQLCVSGENDKYPRSELIEFIRRETAILAPTRYKLWPTEQSWLQF